MKNNRTGEVAKWTLFTFWTKGWLSFYMNLFAFPWFSRFRRAQRKTKLILWWKVKFGHVPLSTANMSWWRCQSLEEFSEELWYGVWVISLWECYFRWLNFANPFTFKDKVMNRKHCCPPEFPTLTKHPGISLGLTEHYHFVVWLLYPILNVAALSDLFTLYPFRGRCQCRHWKLTREEKGTWLKAFFNFSKQMTCSLEPDRHSCIIKLLGRP